MKQLQTAIIFALLISAWSSVDIASAKTGLKGVSAKCGIVDQKNSEATFGGSVVMEVGLLVSQLSWENEVAYWSRDSRSSVAMLSSLRYCFPVPKTRYAAFLGSGLGLHRIGGAETRNRFGFHLMGGLDVGLSPKLTAFAELRYSFVTGANQLWLMPGLRYRFGR